MIIMIGSNPQKIDKTRHTILKFLAYYFARGILYAGGIIWIKTEKMVDEDYRKWLGPDWQPKWDGSATLVANHINGFFDVIATLMLFFPALVGKKSVADIPFIGTVGRVGDPILIDRMGTKEDKEAALRAIEARQRENEQTNRPSLIIFPEGGTTNGEYLIQFKRGPFNGLHSVQPFCLNYWTPNGYNAQGCTLHFLSQFYMVVLATFFTMHVKIYPVFKPNDYFFKHHWDESSGEKKWEAYARVIR